MSNLFSKRRQMVDREKSVALTEEDLKQQIPLSAQPLPEELPKAAAITPVVAEPPRRAAAEKPAVYDAQRVPFTELSSAQPARVAPHPLVETDPDGKPPVRLILDVNVPPGCRPVVLILDGQPATYHMPTKNHPPTKAQSAEEPEPVVFHSASYSTAAK